MFYRPRRSLAAIAACQNGDREAFEDISCAATPAARWASRATCCVTTRAAEDVSQEAFVRAFRAIKRFDLTQPFFPWFYRILKNCCLTALRKRNRRRGVHFSIDTEDSPPVEGPPSNPGCAGRAFGAAGADRQGADARQRQSSRDPDPRALRGALLQGDRSLPRDSDRNRHVAAVGRAQGDEARAGRDHGPLSEQ